MEAKKSNLKENILTALMIFTFVIPVIPIGGYYAYEHFFGNKPENSSSSAKTFQVTNESSSIDEGDPLRGGGTYSAPTSSSVYDCTSDCSGHEAGYEWAEENDVCDTEYDGGNSESFAEGVRAYAEAYCSTDDSDYEEDYDYYR